MCYIFVFINALIGNKGIPSLAASIGTGQQTAVGGAMRYCNNVKLRWKGTRSEPSDLYNFDFLLFSSISRFFKANLSKGAPSTNRSDKASIAL